MSKQHYTNADLFYIILNKLKENDLLPSILDYSQGWNDPASIDTDEWDCLFHVAFGCSEGIYLTVYMEGNIGKGINRLNLGTFKTLYDSKEAYKTMSDLGVEFVFALRKFVEENSDSFCWTGYTLQIVEEGKPKATTCWCSSHQSAMKRVRRHLQLHSNDSVIVLKNETNTSRTYTFDDMRKIEMILKAYEK